jgi:outer membrane protein
LQADILMDVRNANRTVREARSMMEVGETSVKVDKARLDIAMARYRHGEALLEDVLEAQADYEGARQTNLQAILSYLTARADFQRALGEDYVSSEQ